VATPRPTRDLSSVPGAMVRVVLAPVTVRLLPKVGVKPMIAVGYFIFVMCIWCNFPILCE
jgi:hypothetical protein